MEEEMTRWRCTIPLLVGIMLICSIGSIHAENRLEHKNEEETQIYNDTHLYEKLTVDKNDENAYHTISEALNDASPDTTIYIRQGYYNEILTINKRITLQGEDKYTTIINPASTKNSYTLCIKNKGVTLQNLGIQNQGPGLYTTGVKISAPQATITNCYFFHTPIGIAIWSSDTTVTQCHFHGCDDEGIALLGTAHNPCSNTVISSCTFTDNCDGIELQYSTYNTITNCQFSENTHAGIDAIGQSNNHNTITQCTFTNNDAFGVYISGSTDNTLTDCTFSSNTLMATKSTEITVDNCKLDDIYLKDQSSLTINNCGSVDESQIKTLNSYYTIEESQQAYSSVQQFVEKRNQIRQTFIDRILEFLSMFRLA